MANGHNQDMGTSVAPGKISRTLRIILILSLGFNLLIIGLWAGAAMSGHGRAMHRMAMDVGFGPLTMALSREDRKSMRQAFLRDMPDLDAGKQAAALDFADLVAALKAEPWDSAAAEAALVRQGKRSEARLAQGREVLLRHIAGMSAAERQAFAERIEEALTRHRHRGR
ncbi:MAG: periplasmic heavy metal sensor [Albidovulum sp.]